MQVSLAEIVDKTVTMHINKEGRYVPIVDLNNQSKYFDEQVRI
jgi:hypothetical protein